MLDIDIEFRRGVLFVRIIGSLIESTKNKFKNEIKNIIDRSGIINIVINLDNVDKIDNNGLNCLYELKEVIEKENGNIVICNTPVKLENKLFIYKTRDELTALNTFNI